MPDGNEHTINFYAPTGEEWVAHFKDGLARLADDYNQHKVANNLASALKASAKLALGISETENPKPDTVEKAKAIWARVQAGEVFDLREFVASEPRKGGEGDPVVKLIKEKWEASEKKAAFLAKFGLDAALITATTDEVVAAYKASDSML
jgi:hypothetical protein